MAKLGTLRSRAGAARSRLATAEQVALSGRYRRLSSGTLPPDQRPHVEARDREFEEAVAVGRDNLELEGSRFAALIVGGVPPDSCDSLGHDDPHPQTLECRR